MKFMPAAALCALLLSPALPVRAEDSTITIAPEDRAMAAAVAAARESLPQMLAAQVPETGESSPSFSLKVSFPVSGHAAEAAQVTSEAIWVGGIARDGGAFAARLDNDPEFMPGLSLGSPVRFREEQIIDWSLTGDDDRIYGHYTTRALLPHMDPAEAAWISGLLAEEPMPR